MRLTSLLLAGTLAFAPAVAAPAQATAYSDQPPLLLGAAWYPEQWPEAQWEPDLALMEAAHILSGEPIAIQLRYLQTLTEIGVEKNTTIVFPLPVDMISAITKAVEKIGT